MMLKSDKSWTFETLAMPHSASGHRFHHLIAPVGLAVLFGTVAFLNARASITELPIYFVRPLLAVGVIWLVMVPSTALINGVAAAQCLPLIVRLVMASLVGALPLSFLLPWALQALDLSGPVEDVASMTITVYDEYLVQRYVKIFTLVAVLWVVVNYRWYQVHEFISASSVENTVSSEPVITEQVAVIVAPAFTERMTKSIGREVWAVKAEQHYIRIYTPKGDELILYRFGDALRDLETQNGLQVHRSFWVAANAVEKVETNGSGLELKLRNGLDVPVSRSFKALVEQAGWIKA